jgi:VWFA-related protein
MLRLVRHRWCWLFCIVILAFAQTLPAQQAPVPATPDAPAQEEPAETLKVNVNVVNVFFSVKDKHGALIPGLLKDDFQIFEDGKPQTIKYFSTESDQPLTLGILVDTSGSQKYVLGMEKEAGSMFLNQVLTDKDQAFLINFDINVELGQDFTNSKKLLKDALEKTQINTGAGSCAGIPGAGGGPFPCSSSGPKGTLLYDAVYLAAHDELAHEVGRKAMILLTDGEDQGSRTKIREAIEYATKADAICYVLLVADRGISMGFGGSDMHKLTEDTGGRTITVGNDPRKLHDAFDEIAKELRNQYNIGFVSTNKTLDGGYRKLEIKTKQDMKVQGRVQVRKGYYAISQ